MTKRDEGALRGEVEQPSGGLGRFVLGPFRKTWLLVLALLRQGLTPKKLALTIALGIVLGLFPVVGTTTILCAAVAIPLRLNLPLIQAVNYLVYPLQIIMIIPFIRMGEWIFGSPKRGMSATEITKFLTADPLGAFSALWALTLPAIVAWTLVAAATVAVTYVALVPVLRRFVPEEQAAGSEGKGKGR